MSDLRRTTGQRAEEICARRLSGDGWKVLARNWRIRAGELDLIARTGSTLVFVEVKSTHKGLRRGPTAPALAVDPNKQRKIRRLASAWLAGPGGRFGFRDVRFDVVGILFGHDGEIAAYDHIEDAF
ncbi:MAG: YraN family protein [Thermoleophilia bacterium]|nr:YraN family protein [Thermoleophilia bacterium]